MKREKRMDGYDVGLMNDNRVILLVLMSVEENWLVQEENLICCGLGSGCKPTSNEISISFIYFKVKLFFSLY